MILLGATDLIKLIKQSALDAVTNSSPTEVIFGTVSAINPLEVTILQKIVLSEKQLILARNVTEYEIEMSLDHETEKYEYSHEHNHEVSSNCEGGAINLTPYKKDYKHSHSYKGRKKFIVHNDLKVDEIVILVSMVGGQRFVILDRVGGGSL